MFNMTPDRNRRAGEILAAYPQRRAAILPLLWLVQEQEGEISQEAMAYVAELAGVAKAEVCEVKSFYAMFNSSCVGAIVRSCDRNSMGGFFDRTIAPTHERTGFDERTNARSHDRTICAHPVISRHFDVPRMHELNVARQHGAYVSLAKLSRMKPEEVVALVMDSGLRGRGGAGFPAGEKWRRIERRAGAPVYLVVNADEGEPGAFKDRAIMERDPHLLLEGIEIAAYAIEAEKVFVYIRGEYEGPQRIFEHALGEACAGGTIQRDYVICRGAGAYICGEEGALLNSIEGRRGEARIKPPYPTQAGLFGCPTVVQNVETLVSLPFILREGAMAFRRIGTPQSPGTKLISISGDVERPGVYEVEMGTSLSEFISGPAGGVSSGKRLKALFPGGVSVPVLTAPEALTARIDFESIEDAGSKLGTGGMIAIGEGTCMVRVLSDIARFFADESCGECTQCREGCGWIAGIARRMELGQANRDEINVMIDAADGMSGRTICALAHGLASATLSIIAKFRNEFEQHVKEGHCPCGR